MPWWLILLLWLGGILTVAALVVFGSLKMVGAFVQSLDEAERRELLGDGS